MFLLLSCTHQQLPLAYFVFILAVPVPVSFKPMIPNKRSLLHKPLETSTHAIFFSFGLAHLPVLTFFNREKHCHPFHIFFILSDKPASCHSGSKENSEMTKKKRCHARPEKPCLIAPALMVAILLPFFPPWGKEHVGNITEKCAMRKTT